jgi:hypothetical protein
MQTHTQKTYRTLEINKLRILQANCWKSREKVTMHLFGEKELWDFEILAIQEPSINPHTEEMTTYSQALGGRFHTLLKPTRRADSGNRPRVCFFVHKKLDRKRWTVQYHSKDLSTLTLHTETWERCTYTIYTTQARAQAKGEALTTSVGH